MTTEKPMSGKRPRRPRRVRTSLPRHADSGEIDLGGLPDLVGYAIRQAQISIFRDFRRSFAKFDIRPIQYGVLAVIESNPGLKQSQVCAALGIKRANFVPLLNDLERRKLAERRSAKDQRANALHLTKKGAQLMQKLREINKAHERRVAAKLTEKERSQLIELLNRTRKAAAGNP
jgi:DNA-binding MarR family transcriptional regulator